MRSVYLVLTLVLLVALTVQFYLAGVGYFSNPEDHLFAYHGMNGRYVLSIGSLLVLVASFFIKAGGRTIALSALPLVLILLQPVIFILSSLVNDDPEGMTVNTAATVVLALHVLIGLAAWFVTYHLFNRARGLVSEARAASAPTAKSESVSV